MEDEGHRHTFLSILLYVQWSTAFTFVETVKINSLCWVVVVMTGNQKRVDRLWIEDYQFTIICNINFCGNTHYVFSYVRTLLLRHLPVCCLYRMV